MVHFWLLLAVASTIAALWLRQRPSAGFWACSALGVALVLGFAWSRGANGFQAADGLLLLAIISSSSGYVSGAQLTLAMSAEKVICWVLVLSLPLTAPLGGMQKPTCTVKMEAILFRVSK